MGSEGERTMETGKVQYAPDYKSKSQVKRIAAQTGKKYPDMTDKFKAMELRSEHARLQAAIVEEVRKEDRKGMLTQSIQAARDALIAFEVEYKIGERPLTHQR